MSQRQLSEVAANTGRRLEECFEHGESKGWTLRSLLRSAVRADVGAKRVEDDDDGIEQSKKSLSYLHRTFILVVGEERQ